MHRIILFCFLIAGTVAADSELTGEWEGQLLSARRPIVISINFNHKTARLDATGSHEWQVQDLRLEGANIKFVISSGEKLEFSGTMIGGQMSGMMASEKQTAFALNRLPDLQPAKNKIEGWRQDLQIVIDRFFRYDRSYSESQRKEAIRILQDLQSTLEQRTEEEIIVGLSTAIAQTENAHTRLYLLRNRTELSRYPVRLWWFTDGLHVIKATNEHQDLLGCRVTRIGVHEPVAVRRQVADLFPGNESWVLYKSVYYMTSPEILQGLRLIADATKSQWTFQCRTEVKKKTLTPQPLERKNTPTEAWWDLTPEWNDQRAGWSHWLNNRKIPLFLKRPEEHYWFETIPSKQTLYFQYNRSQNRKDAETVQQFGDRLLKTFNHSDIKTLVVDLRFNTGGDLGIAESLMASLQKKATEKQAKVFVLLSRSTFSAGISHAVQWKEWGNATFAGEPCGDVLDFFSEGGNLILPNSKLTAHYTNGFHTYSKKEYPAYTPYFKDMNVDDLDLDVRVETSSDQYFSGKDPVMDAVIGDQ